MRSRLSNVTVQMLFYLYVNLRLLNKLTSEMGDFFTDDMRDSNSHEFEEIVDPITCMPNEELEETLMRLMRLLWGKNLVSPLHSHGRMCHHRIVVLLPSAQRWITRCLSSTLPQRPPRNRTSPPSLHVREYVRTYISQQINSLSPPCHTLGEQSTILFDSQYK